MSNPLDRMNGSVDVTAAEIAAQLDRLVTHPTFVQAPILARFLKHVVDRTLANELRELKEYSIAISVFDRGKSFDPRTDNVVRANARRLRHRLEAYYRSDGLHDPVIIEMPKGGYTVCWRANGSGAAEPNDRPLSVAPRVRVRRVEPIIDDLRILASEVIDEIQIHLSKMTSIDVVLVDQHADYELGCSVKRIGHVLRISIRLVSATDGAVLWAGVFEQAFSARSFNSAMLVAHMVDSVIDADLNFHSMEAFDKQARRELAKGQIQWRSWVLGAGGNARVAAEHWRAALRREPRLWWAQLQMVGHLANRIDHMPLERCIHNAHRAARELLALRRYEHLYPGPVKWAHVIGILNHRLDLDYDLAERAFRHAKVQNWDAGQVDFELGNVHAAAGRLDEASSHYEDAIARDAQLNQTMSWWLLGRTQIAMQHSGIAVASLQTAVDTALPGTRTHLLAQLELIEALSESGQVTRAKAILEHAWSRSGESYRHWFAPAFALLGHTRRAQCLLEEIQSYQRGHVDGMYSAFATYALLRDFDRAFVWLNRVIDNREVFRFVTIRHAPYFEELRSDTRFETAMRRLQALEAKGSPLRPVVETALRLSKP